MPLDDTPNPIPTKQCYRCKRWLPATLGYFHRANEQADGLRITCKQCRSTKEGFRYRLPARDGYKRCFRCGEEKPAHPEYFTHLSEKKDGFHPVCRQCNNKTNMPYLAPAREGFKRCIACKEEKPATPEFFRRTTRNQDGLRACCKQCAPQHAKRNPDQARESNRRYEKKHPERTKVKTQKRIALRRSLPVAYTESNWKAAVNHFNGQCAVCARPPGLWHTLAMDHWLPLSDPDCPGTIPTNIVPLCHGIDGCNNSKNKKEARAWLTSRYGPRKATTILARIEAYFASLG